MITLEIEFCYCWEYKQYELEWQSRKFLLERELSIVFRNKKDFDLFKKYENYGVTIKNSAGDIMVITHADKNGKLQEEITESFCDLICCFPKIVKETHPEFEMRRINLVCENHDKVIYTSLKENLLEYWVSYIVSIKGKNYKGE